MMDKIVHKSRSFISFVLSFLLQVSRLRFVCSQSGGIVIYGQEGETIRLICPLSPPDVNGRTVWNGPPSMYTYFINEAKNPNVSKGERLTVVRNTQTGGYDLQTTGITKEEDVGLYSCDVNTIPPKEYRIYLKLYLPPSSIDIDSYNEDGTLRVHGTEDSPLNLSCQSSGGDPPATVSWFKGSALLVTGINRTLYSFIPTRVDDLQNYTCTAYNPGLSQPMRKNVQIFLDLRPTIPEIAKIPNTKENDQIMVTCSSSWGRPPASLWWIFRGTYLKSTYVSSTMDSLTQTYTVDAMLNITVNKEDNGKTIMCMANNSVVPTGLQSSQRLTVICKLAFKNTYYYYHK